MLNHKKIGRYEVVAVMGQGAMGTVYKAADPVIERVVAIKTINLHLSKEERAEFEERFYREAKSAGRLNHPNIVTIYDVGETEDAAYIAMEYIDGESLREVLDSGVVLPLKRICHVAAYVAKALDYAHEKGVVHRDIKPANIMISRRGEVKLMDFGIALIPTGSRTQVGTVLGSPKYMAPEQLAGKETDGRADIFSLGVVLYEMLTGSTPFNGDNLSAIMYKILNEEPPRPSALNASVPPACDRIIARALAKKPEDRYQTAKEFYRELRNYDAPESQETRQAGTREGTAQKPPAGIAQRQAAAAADPLDVKTALLMPTAERKAASQKAPPARVPKSRRNIALLAIPVLALAAYAVLQATRQTQPPAQAPASIAEDTVAAAPPALLPEAVETPAAAPAPPLPEQPGATASRQPEPRTQPPAQAAAKPRQPAAVPAAKPPQTTAPVAQAPVAAPEAPAAQAAKGTLTFAITPWGEIYIDGRKAGISPPLTELELAPGAHSVEIRNSAFAPHHVKVNLDASETLKIKHIFK